jgi:hypothetical protein
MFFFFEKNCKIIEIWLQIYNQNLNMIVENTSRVTDFNGNSSNKKIFTAKNPYEPFCRMYGLGQ